MRIVRPVLFSILLLTLSGPELSAQEETVPVGHPVYTFLKRMDIKGKLERYRDAALPLSRRSVVDYLEEIDTHRSGVSVSDQGWLDDFLSEFHFDATGSLERVRSVLGEQGGTAATGRAAEFRNAEKFLYASNDSLTSLFVNALVDVDVRAIRGDALGSEQSEYLQFGGRIRGTALGHIGFMAQATNAQFWGSRELLQRDPVISRSYGIYTTDAKNFDFSEGYIRYGSKLFSIEVGQQRLLWGVGQGQPMLLSENPQVFPAIRMDIEYKSLKYTFLHGWILGQRSSITFEIPQDTAAAYLEPVIADKYVAGHRFEFSFPGVLDFGFTEMYIYANRSVDLAYLNPFVLLESAQRSRGERDNGSWAFDLRTRCFDGIQFYGTIFYDDIHVGELFTNVWYDRYAWQGGLVYADVLTIPNTTLYAEYTRVEPWVYGHNRSREGSFTSGPYLLGPRIGPNADSWYFRLDVTPTRNLFLSARVLIPRKGQNVYDASGYLVVNAGADPLVPHRSVDPETKQFLGGNLEKGTAAEILFRYEPINQIWLEGSYQYDRLMRVTAGGTEINHSVILHLRTEL
jgi:hypothetical protein